ELRRHISIRNIKFARHRRSRWRPREITRGKGVLELMANTVSARSQPQLALGSVAEGPGVGPDSERNTRRSQRDRRINSRTRLAQPASTREPAPIFTACQYHLR